MPWAKLVANCLPVQKFVHEVLDRGVIIVYNLIVASLRAVA